MHPSTHRVVCALLALGVLLGPALAAPPAQAPALTVAFDAQGLASLAYQGTELLVKGPAALEAVTPNAEGKVVSLLNQAERKTTVDGGTVTLTYPALTVVTALSQVGETLKLLVTVRNTGVQPITRISYKPLTLQFPTRPKGTVWKWGYRVATNNTGVPGVVEANYGAAEVLACVDEIERPVTFGFDGNYGNSTRNALVIETAPADLLKPGEEKAYRFSLRFAPPATPALEVARDLYDQFAKAYPYKLDWPDRRPIGALFLCQSGTKWATNPRGWFNDPKIDVTTPEGRKAFGERMLKTADTCIAQIKEVGGQGMIFWSVEGEEMPHALTYLGDPRVLPQSAPEMDAVADDFFRKFRDAGLKVGVCIRPSRVIPNGKGGWGHLQVEDHVAEMAEKIAYAKGRWGCTIFYMDTNVRWSRGMWSGDSWILPASDLAALTRRHPDVLIFPEFGSFGYWSCCMPYGELRGGTTKTNDTIRAVYPQTGSTITVGDGDYLGQYDSLLAGARAGDIHLFRGWFGDSRNVDVKRLYQEVDYLRKAPGVALKGVTLERALANPDPLVRYAAVHGVKPGDKAATPLLLGAVAAEKDWAVQKGMVALLGAADDPAVIPALVALLKDKGRGLDFFAARALGALGSQATPALTALLAEKDARVVERALLALSANADPAVLPALLPLTEHPAPAVRLAAMRALGRDSAPESVDKLLALLASDKPEELVAVCDALGRLKERRACGPLVETIVRAVTTLKNNTVRLAAGDALEAITGLEHGPHEGRWKRALADGTL